MKNSVVTGLLFIIPAALLISSEKILAASPAPEQSPLNKNTAAALAQELVAEGNAKRVAYNVAAEKIRRAELQLKGLPGIAKKIEDFFSNVHPDDVEALPGVVAETKKQMAALQSAMHTLQNAATEAGAVRTACEQAESRACEYAKRSAGASEADVKTWQSEATSLISQATQKNQETQAKVKAFQETSDNFQVALKALESYATAMNAAFGNPDGDNMLANFETTVEIARELAKEARDAVIAGNAAAGSVRQICQRIRRVLRPFEWRSSDTALLNKADELERDMTDLTFTDSEEIIQGTRKRVDEFAAVVEKIETLAENSGANAALTEARQAAASAAAMRASLSGLANNAPAEAALQRASKCLAEIQFKPKEEDEVVVPNLSVFTSVPEMKATLAHAGLSAAVVAAKDQPPSKEKEFKFAGQDPAPDTKVKRGSTVTIAIYQKFEGSGPAASDADDIVGHWAGTMSFRKTKDPIAFDIQRQGSGYVLVNKAENKTTPATYSGGKLLAVSKSAVKSAGLTQAATIHIELTREGETLSGTLVIEAANGSRGAPVQLLLTRQSK